MLRTLKTRRPNGLTLIELLVVIFIMMIFVAAAAPLVNPATSDRKIREASRQLNAFIAEAKAHAAQRGRPVGIAFDRASALKEGTRDSNLISHLYLVEVPPIYIGSTLGVTTSLQKPMLANGASDDLPEGNFGGTTINNQIARKIEIKLQGTEQLFLDSIIMTYLPQPIPQNSVSYVPFSIRFNSKGFYYRGCVRCKDNGGTPNYSYFCWAEFGSQLYRPAVAAAASMPTTPPMPITLTNAASFQIALPPVVTGDSQLELPSGTVVDSQFSGYSANGADFFDVTRSSFVPLVILFTPGGSVGVVQSTDPNTGSYLFSDPMGRINLLVGTRKRDAETRDFSVNDDRLTRIQNNAKTNLNDPANLWVSVNPRTGLVTTAENSVPQTLTSVQTAIQEARFQATKLNTKGGR